MEVETELLSIIYTKCTELKPNREDISVRPFACFTSIMIQVSCVVGSLLRFLFSY
jgi:hypothetical protein